MLLPSVPRIIPQLPTLNQTIEVQAAPACNETEINLNRTANETRLSCNATTNGTNASNPDPTASLPGLSFFDNLKVSTNLVFGCQQAPIRWLYVLGWPGMCICKHSVLSCLLWHAVLQGAVSAWQSQIL
jgi:hypothetical protein